MDKNNINELKDKNILESLFYAADAQIKEYTEENSILNQFNLAIDDLGKILMLFSSKLIKQNYNSILQGNIEAKSNPDKYVCIVDVKGADVAVSNSTKIQYTIKMEINVCSDKVVCQYYIKIASGLCGNPIDMIVVVKLDIDKLNKANEDFETEVILYKDMLFVYKKHLNSDEYKCRDTKNIVNIAEDIKKVVSNISNSYKSI